MKNCQSKLFYTLYICLIFLFFFRCDENNDGISEVKPKDSIKNTAIDIDVMIGQMIMTGFHGSSFLDNPQIKKDIKDRHLGGVILLKWEGNIQTRNQLIALTGSMQNLDTVPLFIAIDQEGGHIARLTEENGFSETVSAQYLGELDDTVQTGRWSEVIAKDLYDAGININLAPVVDLNINPESPAIGKWERSFSKNPDKVVKHASVYIKEHHKKGIFCTLKHFPGHGSATDDSHLGFTDISNTWIEDELEPYFQLINAGLCDFIMTAHVFNANLDAEYPATLSENIISGMLRDELNWNGVVISDEMRMKAISNNYSFKEAIEKAINAGVDILLYTANSQDSETSICQDVIMAVKELIADNKISQERIEQSYQRIMAVKSRIGVKQ